MMKEDSTLFSVSPNAYAQYLEQLSDTEFWNHAFEKAHMPRSTHASLATVAPTPDDTLTCITCELRTARCVLPLTFIREILPATQQITLLPDVPPWMLGILSWRGKTVATIDLCAYLTKSNPSPLRKHAFLIIQHEHVSLALCVLSIISATTIVNVNQIIPFTPPPITAESPPPAGIVGIWDPGTPEQDQVFVLDIPALFKDMVQCIERGENHE